MADGERVTHAAETHALQAGGDSTTNGVLLRLSNLSLPPRYLVAGGVEEHRQVLDGIADRNGEGGYAGRFEITPTAALLRSIRSNPDAIRPMEGRPPFATSVRQNGPEGVALKIGRVRRALGSLIHGHTEVVTPDSDASLPVLVQLSRNLGNVPVVVQADYRRGDPDGTDSPGRQSGQKGELANFNIYNLSECSTVITPTNYHALNGLDGIDGRQRYRHYHDSLVWRGIHGVVIDPYYLSRHGTPHNPNFRLSPDTILTQVASTGTPILGIRVTAGTEDAIRTDDKHRSRQDLAALLASPEAIGKTAMGKIVLRAYEIWHNQRGVTSLPEDRVREYEVIAARIELDLRDGVAAEDFARDIDSVGQYIDELTFLRSRNPTPLAPPPLAVTVHVPHSGLVTHHRSRADNSRQFPAEAFADYHQAITTNLVGFFATAHTKLNEKVRKSTSEQ